MHNKFKNPFFTNARNTTPSFNIHSNHSTTYLQHIQQILLDCSFDTAPLLTWWWKLFPKTQFNPFPSDALFTSMLSGIQKGLELTRNIGHLAWSTIIWPCSNLAYPLRKSVHFSLYNHGHNILRLFETLPNFLFTTSETKRDY